MMYESAVIKLRDMAKGQYSSIQFNTNMYANGDTRSSVRLYLVVSKDAPGYWTGDHSSFDGAFAELQKHIYGELPGYSDEAPAGDAL
jgi:hypothetical protein